MSDNQFTGVGQSDPSATRDPDTLLALAAERGVDPLSLLDLPDDEADERLLDLPYPQDIGDTVVLTREQYTHLWVGDESWRRWWDDPRYVEDAVNREISARFKQTSLDICRSIRANQVARGDLANRYTWTDIGPSFAELEVYRSISAWTYPCVGVDRCAECDVLLRHCKIVITEYQPLAAGERAHCERHRPGQEKPTWCMEHRPADTNGGDAR
jgi:hypothetical protein